MPVFTATLDPSGVVEGANRAKNAISGLATAFNVLGGTIASTMATKGIVDALQIEKLSASVEQLGKNAGYSSIQLDKYSSQLQRLGVSQKSALQTTSNLITSQVSLAHAQKLTTIALDASVTGNVSYVRSMDIVTRAIQSGSAEALRGIGVNVDFTRSYRTLASQLGVSSSSLSEAQKQQARLNSVMAAGEAIVGSYAAYIETGIGKLDKFGDALVDTAVDFGKLVLAVEMGAGFFPDSPGLWKSLTALF